MGTVVLSVDGFPSAEVDNIRRLSALLGAKFTPVLTPGITTHLLAATKGTAATQTAISLGCYVVSGKWLEDCARLGFKVSELAAPPLSPAKPPPEPPLSPQTGRLDAHGLLTTSQLNPIQTTLVARVEEIDGPEEAPHSQRPPTQRPISPRPSPPSPPRATESKPIIFSELLRGVVVYVSKALSAREPELADKAAKMGAEHRWTFDEFVTHLVHHGRGHPELKRAQYHKYLPYPLALRSSLTGFISFHLSGSCSAMPANSASLSTRTRTPSTPTAALIFSLILRTQWALKQGRLQVTSSCLAHIDSRS